jgi:hypothetical protein
MSQSSTDNELIWIKTRDGSPTLWNNTLGESYRSVKGAFTESLVAFVRPALAWAKAPMSAAKSSIQLVEFGLGAGTNWVLFSMLAKSLSLEHSYCAIERDLSSFKMGLKQWRQKESELQQLLQVQVSIDELQAPRVFSSVEAAQDANIVAQLWFHDPFGFDVNPDGYSAETLKQCASLWHPTHFWGGSYACNSQFQKTLQSLDRTLNVSTHNTQAQGLKRERLEFSKGF